jgi:Crp-like helix-turn-helix domain
MSTFKLLNKGDAVPVGDWQIKEGLCVSRTWGDDGVISIFGFWGEGDLVFSAPKDYDKPLEIVCMSSTELEKIDASSHYEQLRQKAKDLERLLIITQIRPISDRIHSLLKWFDERFGNKIQLTHQDIASTLNTTRVTVTRCLKDLEIEGKIKRNKRKIIFVR